MTLRTRLLVSVAGLLAVALLAAGAALIQVTRANLIEQVDRDLISGGRGPGLTRAPGRGDADDPTGRRTALLLLDGTGMVLESAPSGFASRPDPLPDLTPLFASDGSGPTATGVIVDATSADGSVAYRVVIGRGPSDTWAALAAPLTGMRQTLATLVRNLVLVGLAALLSVIAVGWVVIRRGLRPIEEMALATTRIAEGDLDHRVAHPPDTSEVGRLGAAFNVMLDRIQQAFAAQQRSLEASEASETRLRRFVADASHELRTPLTSVRGYAELYRAGGLSEQEALDKAMDRIETESRRMGRLVEDLLLLARLDQGRALREEPVDVSVLVDDAISDLRTLESGRSIEATIAPGVLVAGDEDRLRQVVGNLIANVLVHTPPTTAVEVAVDASDGVVRIRLIDHGPGILAADAEHVFDRFYRADPARARERGGSGLGLAIATAIVEAHGGTIQHAATPGGGATFIVTLPRLRGDRAG